MTNCNTLQHIVTQVAGCEAKRLRHYFSRMDGAKSSPSQSRNHCMTQLKAGSKQDFVFSTAPFSLQEKDVRTKLSKSYCIETKWRWLRNRVTKESPQRHPGFPKEMAPNLFLIRCPAPTSSLLQGFHTPLHNDMEMFQLQKLYLVLVNLFTP